MPVDLKKLLELAHRVFEDVKAPHALMGAFAMSVHGYQRATNDIDFLVHGDYEKVVETEFLKLGFNTFHKTEEVLQLSGIGSLDIIFANRQLSQKMLMKKLPRIHGVPCLLPEDIIGLKIQAIANNKNRRLRDLADIQSLAEKCRDLNWAEIKQYADLFDLWDELKAIKDTIER